MKKITTVIEKCSDCPFRSLSRDSSEHAVHLIFKCKKLAYQLLPPVSEPELIPDWCPLEDETAGISSLNAELGKRLDEVMKKALGTSDIITQYMRKERLKND